MVFHQVQLMTCAVLARRYQKKQQEQQTTPNGQAVRE
jgi:sodium/bile acid cotransporter 7